jgi:hypothetical protein
MTIGNQQLRRFIYKIIVAGKGIGLQQSSGLEGLKLNVLISFKFLWCLDLQNSHDPVF